jgi:hypothetical protein
MIPPKIPFPTYKWRWASFEPTEGLNDPAVYLGVLRVLRKFEGEQPRSRALAEALGRVQVETNCPVDLVRTPQRNLVRNSGQYWKATGLLADSRSGITLTDFGNRVASGEITRAEFATTVIKTLTLPNVNIISDVSDWEKAQLQIKPLELILSLISELGRRVGKESAYITADELIKIVIPLAGAKSPPREYIASLSLYREGKLDLSRWPDCAPSSNDKRIAREFLLFLAHHGFCKVVQSARQSNYVLLTDAAKIVRSSGVPNDVERERVVITVLNRTQQPRFRRAVFNAFSATCLLSGETIREALEAAHIKPVEHSGPDTRENGLCLRADIHNLFDAGHIRIESNGTVHYTELALNSVSYSQLPTKLVLPGFIDPTFLEWRWNYY